MVGTKIAEIRNRLKLTQTEFGIRIGKSQTQVSDLERDIVKPDSEALSKIAKLGNTSVDWLLSDSSVSGIIVKNENGDVHVNHKTADECQVCKAKDSQLAALQQLLEAQKDIISMLKAELDKIKNPA